MRKNHLILEQFGVKFFPSPNSHCFASIFAINRMLSFALGFDFNNVTSSILAADQKVRAIVMPTIITPFIFHQKIRFIRIGQSTRKVNVIHFIWVDFQQTHQLFKKAFFRFRIKIIGIIMKAIII